MPLVTGTLSDFGFASLAPLQPEVHFIPSSVGLTGGRLLASRRVVSRPDAAGYFQVDLASTDTVAPAAWYEVEIRWVETAIPGADGGYPERASIDARLFVPTTGGTLPTLLRLPSNNQLMPYFQPTMPDPWPAGTVWINSATGDVNRKA